MLPRYKTFGGLNLGAVYLNRNKWNGVRVKGTQLKLEYKFEQRPTRAEAKSQGLLLGWASTRIWDLTSRQWKGTLSPENGKCFIPWSVASVQMGQHSFYYLCWRSCLKKLEGVRPLKAEQATFLLYGEFIISTILNTCGEMSAYKCLMSIQL